MTREEFEKKIGFVEKEDEHKNLIITGGIKITAQVTISRQYKHDKRILEQVKYEIKERLWHEVYEDRRKMFMETLMNYRMCNLPMNEDALKYYNELVQLLKGL